MTDHDPAPFLSHVVRVSTLPRGGARVTVEADEAARARMARAFDLRALPYMKATFTLGGDARRLRVKGRLRAEIRQTCVVTLDEFDSAIDEDIDLVFSEDAPPEGVNPNFDDDGDGRVEDIEPIIDDRIDLGALAAEYLSLAIDPWPRRPGASFDWKDPEDGDSPFAALRRLKPSGDGG
ncbi:DUF177 domain-containing protein [Camelimonas abortus]|uniref:YceD family protein n=1 Tax=Camelimonas abortus TaxID=1017184 RepID=A0ABV7LC99_9HYPH